MQKKGAMLTFACMMLCLTFNYTFPLRREGSMWNLFGTRNVSSYQSYCNKNHNENIGPKKKSDQYHHEKALKVLRDSNAVNGKIKIQANCTLTKNTDDDIRHFEQMVIKKKNPYLDLKELELRYYNPKNVRQSVDPGSIVQDPSLCESLEDGPNVEITNRGLSGFAIPSKLLKEATLAEIKIKTEIPTSTENTDVKTIGIYSKQRIDTQLLKTLEDDIRQFEELKDNT